MVLVRLRVDTGLRLLLLLALLVGLLAPVARRLRGHVLALLLLGRDHGFLLRAKHGAASSSTV